MIILIRPFKAPYKEGFLVYRLPFANLSAFFLFGPRFQNWGQRIRPLGGNFTENPMFTSKAINSGVQKSKSRKMAPECSTFFYYFEFILFWPPKGQRRSLEDCVSNRSKLFNIPPKAFPDYSEIATAPLKGQMRRYAEISILVEQKLENFGAEKVGSAACITGPGRYREVDSGRGDLEEKLCPSSIS